MARLIFGHRATGDQHGGDGDDIAQGFDTAALAGLALGQTVLSKAKISPR
ncbi:hypothetical protein O5290_30075 [Escherichia coli]|nr:hypothetical protein [Escherichia coli]